MNLWAPQYQLSTSSVPVQYQLSISSVPAQYQFSISTSVCHPLVSAEVADLSVWSFPSHVLSVCVHVIKPALTHFSTVPTLGLLLFLISYHNCYCHFHSWLMTMEQFPVIPVVADRQVTSSLIFKHHQSERRQEDRKTAVTGKTSTRPDISEATCGFPVRWNYGAAFLQKFKSQWGSWKQNFGGLWRPQSGTGNTTERL